MNKPAAAVAFASADGGTICVVVGPSGCMVSKDQRHVAHVVDGAVVLRGGGLALSPADVGAILVAADGLGMVVGGIGSFLP